MVCAAGGADPTVCRNDSCCGETDSDGGTGTVNVTATVLGLLLARPEVIVIVPVYVPGAKLSRLTLTEIDAGVTADCGATDSQFPPLSVVADKPTEIGRASCRE